MRQGHAGAEARRREANRAAPYGLLRAMACVGALCFVVIPASQARADWIFPDTLYNFTPSGLGGGYEFDPAVYLPPGSVAEPYGGYWDNITRQAGQVHPGYPYTFPGGEADIPDYIFDDEPGDPFPVNFLSLPGNPAQNNTSSITFGFSFRAIDPLGPGNDLLIEEAYNEYERAHIYVSNRIVADPRTFTDDDFDFVCMVFAGQVTEINFEDYGFTEPFQAIKIEGRDTSGESFGYDLVRAMVSRDSVTGPIVVIPEPGALVLFGIGGLAIAFGWVRRGRRRKVC